jgi:hypothetical protein
MECKAVISLETMARIACMEAVVMLIMRQGMSCKDRNSYNFFEFADFIVYPKLHKVDFPEY